MATFACLLGTLITLSVLPTGLANANNGSNGKHFLLVHGLGHGGWCWYKVTAALQEAGHMVTAVDLTSSGNNKVAADDVTDVARFLRPLTDFLAAYDNGRVILVGHSFGGSAISYAMEAYPEKVEKAVFLAALMPTNGQTFLPIRTLLARASILLAKRVLILNFRNGLLPSSVSINLEGVQANFYNRSPLEDVALAVACLNPTPFRPGFAKLALTAERYGRIPRFYVKTTDDMILPPDLQANIIAGNPPLKVLILPESDHSPFFSQPAALVETLISIANN